MFTFHLCNSRKCIAPRFIARSVNLKLHPRKITQSGCKDGLVDIFRRHFRAETLAEIRMCSPAASHSDFLLSVWYEIFNMNAAYPTESIHSLSIQKVPSYQSIRYAIHFHPHPFSFNLMPHFQRFFFWRLAKFLMIIQKFRNQ